MSRASLDSLILAKDPFLYLCLEDISQYPAIPNLGTGSTTASWQGGVPVILPTQFGDVAALDGSKWVELLGGGVIDTSAGFTVEALLLLSELRSFSRIFELGGLTVNQPKIAMGTVDSENSIHLRYHYIDGSTSTSSAVVISTPNLYDRFMHLVGRIDPVSGLAQILINGQLVASTENTFVSASVDAQLGNLFYSLWAQTKPSTDQIAKGFASFVAVYLEPLTDQAIAEHVSQLSQLDTSYFDSIAAEMKQLFSQTPSWANAETKEQAWPGENHWALIEASQPEFAAPITQVPHFTTLPTRAELGYIAGVVTAKQVPAPGRTVRCFDPTMTLVAETVSDAGGHYRFDNLLRNRRYLILAQDTWEFNYAPVGADRRQPESY